MTEKILAAIKELREKAKKRNFSQNFDLIVSLSEFDTKKPENKFTEDLILPNGRGDEARVVLFSDSVKDVGCEILTSSGIEKLAKNKRETKKLIKNTDFFLAEPKLMPLVGKTLGQFLAPRGKMPKLITGDVRTLVESYKKSVRIRVKDSPVIQCSVGNEKMEDEKIAENIEAVIKFLEGRLPKGKHNIGKILLKLTMSKPVRIEA
ncbi:MAG: 50S ribosomal protein L1 [Candidatus Aenigmarchaeota archaeon]|nr:50S ribosomal protein L1 [Candidatus Aenigmarchaeota archaeon]